MAKESSYPPFYTEEAEQASANLRLALPLINQHNAAVNPVNYAVWYEYVSGDNLALANAIDELIGNKQEITADIAQALYEKYVLMDMPDRLENANNGIKLVVDNTLTNINEVESTTNQCLSGFNDSQMALEACTDINDLKNVVGAILADTMKMSQTSNELKENLEQSSQEIAQLKAELNAVKESAKTDALTGLLNRGAFNHELHNQCETDATDTALLFFDLDNFKELNDSYGHLLGDKVLQFFAAILQKYTSPNHIAARYGGEEMAMILLNTSEQEAFDLAETIRLNFANSRLKKRGSDESIGQVTVSIGISMKKQADTPDYFIERADAALYDSKEKGRNQITIA